MLQPFEPLTCDQAGDRLEAWIDGDLDQHAADEVRRHVDGCPSCRRELELAEQVRATLGDLPGFELPARVLRAVQSATVAKPASTAKWWTRPVAAVTAVAAAGLLALVLAPERKTSPPQINTAEVERVTAETRLALAYLSSAARRAEARVKSSVVEDRAVVATLNGVSTSLRWARGSENKPTTKIENEGSL